MVNVVRRQGSRFVDALPSDEPRDRWTVRIPPGSGDLAISVSPLQTDSGSLTFVVRLAR